MKGQRTVCGGTRLEKVRNLEFRGRVGVREKLSDKVDGRF